MRKLLSTLLIMAMMATLFVGCGKKTDSDSGSDSTETVAETDTKGEDQGAEEAAVTEEDITITMLFSGVAAEGDLKLKLYQS